MNTDNASKIKGISLRRLHGWMIVLAVVLALLMTMSTVRLSTSFHNLLDATEEYIGLEKAAYRLMDASDLLTEKAQRFAATGDMAFLADYFEEALEVRSREEAVDKMKEDPKAAAALSRLSRALEVSNDLMLTEYYSMNLVIAARGYTEDDFPEKLREQIRRELSREEALLSADDAAQLPDEQMRRAAVRVTDENYFSQKDEIRDNMNGSLAELEKLTRSAQDKAGQNLRADLWIFRSIILLEVVGIVAVIWLTSRLGISPVLKAVEKIRDDSPIPEIGANEFRYLALTYNKMYEIYKKSVRRLNFNVSHDALTKVYNRAGYDLLLSGLDLSTTYMLLFDVDGFKKINDTYGHETGDGIMIKVAETLKRHFRADDYVCRIGGDEFVVFMIHAEPTQEQLIAANIERINEELSDTSDGLPACSISAGVVHGSMAADAQSMFVRADQALYKSKADGRRRCTFFAEGMETLERYL